MRWKADEHMEAGKLVNMPDLVRDERKRTNRVGINGQKGQGKKERCRDVKGLRSETRMREENRNGDS